MRMPSFPLMLLFAVAAAVEAAPAGQVQMGTISRHKDFRAVESGILDKDAEYKQKKAAAAAASKAAADFRRQQTVKAYRGADPELQRKLLNEQIARAKKLNDQTGLKTYQSRLRKLNGDINKQINLYLKRTPAAQKQMNALNLAASKANAELAAYTLTLLRQSKDARAGAILESLNK